MSSIPIHSSAKSEWYTPAWVIRKAEEALGVDRFDLDPASCYKANEHNVRARDWIQKSYNGLAQDWPEFGGSTGRVNRTFWLNPPYGRGVTAKWVKKAVAEHEAGMTGVLLVNATPDRGWFRPLWGFPVTFLYKRIRFEEECPDGKLKPGSSPTHGNCLVLLAARDAVDEHGVQLHFRWRNAWRELGHTCLP